jgi:hypothetical protein
MSCRFCSVEPGRCGKPHGGECGCSCHGPSVWHWVELAGVIVLCMVNTVVACTPSSTASPPQDVVITSTDSGDPCAVAKAITDQRLIRTESGAPLVVPCDAGK